MCENDCYGEGTCVCTGHPFIAVCSNGNYLDHCCSNEDCKPIDSFPGECIGPNVLSPGICSNRQDRHYCEGNDDCDSHVCVTGECVGNGPPPPPPPPPDIPCLATGYFGASCVIDGRFGICSSLATLSTAKPTSCYFNTCVNEWDLCRPSTMELGVCDTFLNCVALEDAANCSDLTNVGKTCRGPYGANPVVGSCKSDGTCS